MKEYKKFKIIKSDTALLVLQDESGSEEYIFSFENIILLNWCKADEENKVGHLSITIIGMTRYFFVDTETYENIRNRYINWYMSGVEEVSEAILEALENVAGQ